MIARRRLAFSLAALMLVTACGGTNVSDRKELVTGKLPRPDHIYVYPFVATPREVPPDSALAAQAAASAPQTPQQVALGREIGAAIANELAAEIDAMGLSAAVATNQTSFQPNDIVIRGYLLSYTAGSAAERVGIGMGEGAAEIKAAVEGFEVTPGGLRKLGSGDVDTQSSKTPGSAVPLAVAIATKNPLGLIVSTGVKLHGEESGSSTIQGKAKDVAKEIAEQIRPRFEQQGWIASQ
jgi:hypothetical protein